MTQRIMPPIVYMLLLTLAPDAARSQPPGSAMPISEDLKQLDQLAGRITAYLQSLPGYRVTITENWKLSGARGGEGINRIELAADRQGRYRLEVFPEGEQSRSLLCVSDQKTTTRLMRPGKTPLYSEQPGALADLLDDAMTESSVRHSGLDWLCSDDPYRRIMAMVSDVQFVGSEDLDDQTAAHFRARWGEGSGHLCEMWIATGQQPLLRKLMSKIELTGRQGTPLTMTVVSELQWNLEDSLDEELFRVKVPENALKVVDLYGYLIEGGTSDLFGKPAPQLEGTQTNGATWNLSTHVGQTIVVAYFYATWAAPSSERLPEVIEFIDEFESKGVRFYAIDVGESVATAKAFAETMKYERPVVVDSDGVIAEAFRVTSLPTVIVIDRDGTVFSAHVGNNPEVRGMVREELNSLLGSGESANNEAAVD